MAVPYTFGTATSSIPLSQLDSNFNTVITLGNTAIQLGNTVTTLNNMTLANVTISSGNVTITNVAITTANVTTANITTAVIGTETVTTSTITTANVTTANITTGNITNGTVITSLTLSYGTANGVTYLNGSKVLTSGAALTFDGTNFASTGSLTGSTLKTTRSSGAQPEVVLTQTSVASWSIYNPPSSTDLRFYNGSDLMTLTSSGNVGIGTSSPSVKLDVNGITGWVGATTGQTAQIVGASSGIGGGGNFRVLSNTTQAVDVGGVLTLGGYYISTTNSIDFGSILGAKENSTSSNTAGYLAFGTRPNSGNMTERMRIDSSGNVGIGTSSPSALLTLSSGSGTKAVLATTRSFTVNRNWQIAVDEYAEGKFFITPSTTLGGTTFTTPAVTINYLGDIGIGTNSPSARLQLEGSGATNPLLINNGTTAGDVGVASILIYKYDNNTTTSQIFQKFVINNGANGSGSITANGASNAAFTAFSDQRLKENITELPSQLANIMALRPVEFDYIESMGGGHQIGFIAQEVQTIYPDLVGVGENEMLTLTDMNKNDARLIKCIQEQQELITSLTARIEALESR